MATEPTEQEQERGAPTDTKTSGVKVPEAFQQSVSDLVSSCENDEMLDYVMDCCQKKQQEMMETEESDEGETPEEYSDKDMPKD